MKRLCEKVTLAYKWLRQHCGWLGSEKWKGITALGTIAAVLAASIYAAIAAYQLVLMRETAQRQFRAYVLYEGGRVDISKDGWSYTVFIEMKNSGQTPAYSTEYWFNARIMDRLPDPFRYFFPPCVGDSSKGCTGVVKFRITPDEGVTDIGTQQSVCFRKTFPTTSTDWSNKVIYVWGYVTYWDQFQRSQYAAFIRQTVNPIAKEESLKLANILNWATDPEEHSRIYERKLDQKFPWPQEPQQAREPTEASFQGTCPAN